MIDNTPTTANLMLSIVSVVILLAGIGELIWYKFFTDKEDDLSVPALSGSLDTIPLTPSMRAVGKYAVTVIEFDVELEARNKCNTSTGTVRRKFPGDCQHAYSDIP